MIWIIDRNDFSENKKQCGKDQKMKKKMRAFTENENRLNKLLYNNKLPSEMRNTNRQLKKK